MDFTAYISNLSADKRTLLYRSPWTSLAVFRNLPPLAQVYVMRLLFVPHPFPADFLDSWSRQAAASTHRAALTALRGLDVLAEVTTATQPAAAPATAVGGGGWAPAAAGGGPGGGGGGGPRRAWVLHSDFRTQLQTVVCSGSQLMSGDVPPSAAAAAPPLSALGEWAAGQWEALQLFLLGAGSGPPALPPVLRARRYPDLDIRGLLMEAGLLGQGGGRGARGGAAGAGLGVTARGFQWLLLPPERQLWAVLREYISGAEASSGEELASTLSFLLQLGFRRVGQPLGWGALRPAEQRMAAHMTQLGLLAVFQAADGELYYTPTRLASSLCGGGSGGATGTGGGGAQGGGGGKAAAAAAGGGGPGSEGGGGGEEHIIVESNYRVYVYTRSPVTLAVLELFCKREALLPNLFVGSIRRDSILTALRKGITADELVAYLAARPHPSIAARAPVVPEVVSDQIRLWEASLHRLRAEPAVLYDNLEGRALYERAVAHAAAAGTLLWQDGERMRFVAADSGHEDMKQFIMRAKQELKL